MTMTTWITAAIAVAVVVAIAAALWLRDVAAEVAGAEIRAWLPHLSLRKIRRAAMALPPAQRDILEAWEAELKEYEDRPLAMFLLATRIARDRKLTAREAQEIALESSLAAGRTRTASVGLPAATALGRALVDAFGKLSAWGRRKTAAFPQLGSMLLGLGYVVGVAASMITLVMAIVTSFDADRISWPMYPGIVMGITVVVIRVIRVLK